MTGITEELLIREVGFGDAEAIVGFLNPIIQSGAYSAFDTPFSVDDEKRFIRDFPQRGVFCVAEDPRDHRAVESQNLEPYATYTHAFDHVGVIAAYVHLDWRRRGVGRRLSEVTFERACHKGYEKLFTLVRADNRGCFAVSLESRLSRDRDIAETGEDRRQLRGRDDN